MVVVTWLVMLCVSVTTLLEKVTGEEFSLYQWPLTYMIMRYVENAISDMSTFYVYVKCVIGQKIP